ncbi:MAG: prepilin-type N-terminal cleavage/methylation domain-containing protein [bacterium]|nr:prepilin-type N-terminal cleavage/methylation domain-containing protein [bacterium]
MERRANVKSTSQLRSPRSGRFAFTLVELLVVIAIIALLATLIIPSLSSIFGTARSTQCGARLKEIGKAMTMMNEEDTGTVQVLAWQNMIRKYLGQAAVSLTCPEYTHLLDMAGLTEGETEQTPVPLGELAAFNVLDIYYDDMERGPMVAKLSDANWNRARADGWLVSGAPNFPRGNYEDGSEDTANPYWLCFEDYGGDGDFKDIMVKVTMIADGYKVEAMCGGAGRGNWIVDKPDHNKLLLVPANTSIGSLPPIVFEATGFIASYGMNTAVPRLNRPDGIMVMDYNWVLAAPNDVWSDYPHPENNAVPVFARHRERINVVFMDGSVKMMDPHELNPDDINTEKVRWLP